MIVRIPANSTDTMLTEECSGYLGIVCPECSRNDSVYVDCLGSWSDKMALKWFGKEGWDASPVKCPDCIVEDMPIVVRPFTESFAEVIKTGHAYLMCYQKRKGWHADEISWIHATCMYMNQEGKHFPTSKLVIEWYEGQYWKVHAFRDRESRDCYMNPFLQDGNCPVIRYVISSS